MQLRTVAREAPERLCIVQKSAKARKLCRELFPNRRRPILTSKA
jgi:hypothetical protein